MKRVSISLIAAGASALIGIALLRGIHPLGGHTPVSDQLTLATQNTALGTGALVALWYFTTAVGALLVSICRGLGAAPGLVERLLTRFGAPVLRRVLTWSAAATLTVAAPALAKADEPPQEPAAVTSVAPDPRARNAAFLVDLGWGAAADPARESGAGSPPGRSAEPSPVTAPPAAPPGADPPPPPSDREAERARPYTVEPGDTLWSIAESDLRRAGNAPTAAEIAGHWPRWYEHNSATIGANPHLILPGMTLEAPTLESP